MLICPTCRTELDGEAQFCPHDGSLLEKRAPSDPLAGRVLQGRYRLVDRLGQGGMGTVYRAVHLLMDKAVAVKILRRELASDAEAVARFHREARSASRLDHNHCIRVSDFGQSEDGLLFLVMELLEGESLSALLRRGPVEPARAARLAHDIASALAHAHEVGIVHRDLKPDNVLLAKKGRREIVKVLDFGLAKLVSESPLMPAITRDGTVFGTPEYMAPEQAEGGTLDGRTDLYALGVILYYMLCGELPFSGSHFVAVLTRQVSEEPARPSERVPALGIDPRLEAICMRCLAKERNGRFASALELVEALAPFCAPRRESSREISVETPALPPPRKRSWAWAALPMVLVGVGALGTKSLWSRPPPAAPPVVDELTLAEDLLHSAQSDEAALQRVETILRQARVRDDSVRVQEGLAGLAERRGNRLAALAHQHRAARLAPTVAGPQVRLAALLTRLGQANEACKQARSAMKLAPTAVEQEALGRMLGQCD